MQNPFHVLQQIQCGHHVFTKIGIANRLPFRSFFPFSNISIAFGSLNNEPYSLLNCVRSHNSVNNVLDTPLKLIITFAFLHIYLFPRSSEMSFIIDHTKILYDLRCNFDDIYKKTISARRTS